MKSITIFNTSIGSLNQGDYIINNSAKREMAYLLHNNFVVEYPTHTPVTHLYQNIKISPVRKYSDRCELKFIFGTNLLAKNMLRLWPNWNLNIFNCKPYNNSILVGVGMNGSFDNPSFYTKAIYNKVLSKEYTHSTRDEKTKLLLEKMGYKAINTGCPTMWSLTPDLCKKIKKDKSNAVVFTLTDYCPDIDKDKQLINTLIKNYNNVYYWVQGSNDLEYLKSLSTSKKIKLIYSLSQYEELLDLGNIDYVGTRLHAGICALQHKVRSIIITVDNRARDIKETYNLITIERDKIGELDSLINSSFVTNININTKNIELWKSQFK